MFSYFEQFKILVKKKFACLLILSNVLLEIRIIFLIRIEDFAVQTKIELEHVNCIALITGRMFYYVQFWLKTCRTSKFVHNMAQQRHNSRENEIYF